MNGVWVCVQREHFSEFPSANIINWYKLEQWQYLLSDSYDRIASNNTNSLLQVRNAFWVFQRGEGGGAETRYKKYSCKSPCKRKSYETICENIVARYQTLVSSIPREAVFLHRRPKTEFMTGLPGSPVMNNKTIIEFGFRIIWRVMAISEGVILLGYRISLFFIRILTFWNRKYKYSCLYFSFITLCPSFITFLHYFAVWKMNKKSCVLCRNFISIYKINRTLHGRLGIRILSSRAESISHSFALLTRERYFQHEKIKFVSPRGRVISSI